MPAVPRAQVAGPDAPVNGPTLNPIPGIAPALITMPPEWAPQEWLWIGFPHDPDEWPQVLEPAQEQIAAFANVVADHGQAVRLIVRDGASDARAGALCSAAVHRERRAFGDIWLRDTGPLVRGDGTALRPRFNGWGGKFCMAGDEAIGAELARDAGLPVVESDWVLEGGAIDGDGTGTILTTEQCLLNPNRNPDLSRADIEERLRRDLGATQIVWLGDGLVNDHTDGHVDNLARFVAPGQVALPVAHGTDDPNAAIFDDARDRLRAAGLTVHDIPSVGRMESNGHVEPASYANFAITNHVVVVPIFDRPHDDEAVAAIDALFPDKTAIGVPAEFVLAGGGGFHCASQQMPRLLG